MSTAGVLERESAVALLRSAFDEVPAVGSRSELRLSQQELAELKELLPEAQFAPLECEDADKRWYQVQL